MKKKVIICFIFLLLLGCNKKELGNVDLGLSDELNYYIKIYEYEDGRKIYSKFFETNLKSEGISLKEALDDRIITIENIIDNMIYEDSANDGGSTIYKSANGNYYIAYCNTLSGNKDIIIGNDLDVIERCVNDSLKLDKNIKIVYEEYGDDEFSISPIVTLYEDSEYRYTYTPFKNEYVEVLNDNYSYESSKYKQISFEEALERNIITISDLEKIGVKISRHEK